MASVFTKIIKREIPANIVAENTDYIAFLDINPLAEGHTLVVPKKEVDKIWDLTKTEYLDLMDFVYDVANSLEKSIPCLRVGMAVIGLEVPHVHVHLIPLNDMNDINFSQPKLKLDKGIMQNIADSIASNFRKKTP